MSDKKQEEDDKKKPERRHRIERSRRGTWVVRVPLVVVIGAILTAILLLVVLWSTYHERDVYLQVRNAGELNVLMPSMVGLTQSSLDAGNSVQVLENGDGFFPLLLRDIAGARETIHLESYIWWKGAVCDQVAAALAAKARQGVEVRLLVDASGGHKMDDRLQKMMGEAGVKLAAFHPLKFKNLGRLNNRDHRKVAIIDGRIGYIGGYGFAKEWTGHAQDKDHWRDTGVRVEGPVVNRLQGAFCENWIEETGEIPAGDRYFPHLPPMGATPAHVAYTSPNGSISSVELMYYLAIKAARHRIVIQNPYMLPNEAAIDAMADAVRRGVEVIVMVPGTEATDSPIVQHASHHNFGTLMKRGIRVFEYNKTLLHQKLIIVDGVWSCVGSTNFDDRSFDHNDEISMGLLDRSVAAQLEAAFRDDLRYAKERHLDEWRDRPLWHKALDGLAYLGSNQL